MSQELDVKKNIALLSGLWQRLEEAAGPVTPGEFIVLVSKSLAFQQERAAVAEQMLGEWASAHREGDDVDFEVRLIEHIAELTELYGAVAGQVVTIPTESDAGQWKLRYHALEAKIDPLIAASAIRMVDAAIDMGVALEKPYNEVLDEIVKAAKVQVVVVARTWFQKLLVGLLKKTGAEIEVVNAD